MSKIYRQHLSQDPASTALGDSLHRCLLSSGISGISWYALLQGNKQKWETATNISFAPQEPKAKAMDHQPPDVEHQQIRTRADVIEPNAPMDIERMPICQ